MLQTEHNENISLKRRKRIVSSNNMTRNVLALSVLVAIASAISMISLLYLAIPLQKAYAQEYTGYDKYFYQVGLGEGKQWADDDYNNNCRFCNQWADDQAPCSSGDYTCLEKFGWRIGYFDEWCALTDECLDYSTHVD